MASQCCLSVTKYFLFLFNLAFFCLGGLLLTLGVWILLDETSFFMSAPSFMSLSLLSYFLLVGGSCTMSLGFFGSLGALKEVKCMLGMYFFLLTILLVVQIVGGVLFFTQRTAFESTLEDHVHELITSFGKNDSSLQHFEQTLHFIQLEVGCCGWTGPIDWVDAPCSCYHSVNVSVNATDVQWHSCGCPLIPSPSIRTQCELIRKGCREGIRSWLDDHMFIIMGVFLSVAVVEIGGMILSMSMYRWVTVDYNMLI